MLAHGVWLDDDELELIAERGAVVVTNPVANMKLAVGGVFPYPRARAAGVQVGLGTDGAGSNNSLDLFADMKMFALIQKHAAARRRPRSAPPRPGRSPPGAGPRCSAPRPASRSGQPADFLLLAPARPSSASASSPPPRVRRVGRGRADDGRRRGQVLMRDGEIEGADEVLARALERARGSGSRRPSHPPADELASTPDPA